VRIGFAAPLTGPQAHYGQDMLNGARLAAETWAAQPPVVAGQPLRIELLPEDDQADPARATVIAQHLVDAGVVGVVGHFNSGTSIAAAPVYARAGVAEIAMASAPAYTRQGLATTFRALSSDQQQGAAAAHFVRAAGDLKRVAVIDDRSAYGQGLAEEFERALRAGGGTMVRHDYADEHTTDFRALLTRIRAERPDLIFFGGIDAAGAAIARQMRELGLRAILMGGDMLKSPAFLDLAGAAAEGAIATLPGTPVMAMPGGADYAARYHKRFGQDPEVYSPYAYDALNILVAAMQAADSRSPEAIRAALASGSFHGVTRAEIRFAPNGDLLSGVVSLYRVEQGAWRALPPRP
jgi:branched-chain amino acid transport system substrate-binding protein